MHNKSAIIGIIIIIGLGLVIASVVTIVVLILHAKNSEKKDVKNASIVQPPNVNDPDVASTSDPLVIVTAAKQLAPGKVTTGTEMSAKARASSTYLTTASDSTGGVVIERMCNKSTIPADSVNPRLIANPLNPSEPLLCNMLYKKSGTCYRVVDQWYGNTRMFDYGGFDPILSSDSARRDEFINKTKDKDGKFLSHGATRPTVDGLCNPVLFDIIPTHPMKYKVNIAKNAYLSEITFYITYDLFVPVYPMYSTEIDPSFSFILRRKNGGTFTSNCGTTKFNIDLTLASGVGALNYPVRPYSSGVVQASVQLKSGCSSSGESIGTSVSNEGGFDEVTLCNAYTLEIAPTDPKFRMFLLKEFTLGASYTIKYSTTACEPDIS